MFNVKIEVAIGMFWFYSSSFLASLLNWKNHPIFSQPPFFVLQVPSTKCTHMLKLCVDWVIAKIAFEFGALHTHPLCDAESEFFFSISVLYRRSERQRPCRHCSLDMRSNDGAHHKLFETAPTFTVRGWKMPFSLVILACSVQFWNSKKPKGEVKRKVTRKCRGNWAHLFTAVQRKIDSWQFFYLGIR
jgi:hypothetical protein